MQEYLTILLIGIGLSMDAFAVSLSSGCIIRNELRFLKAFQIAFFFGGFQGLMPLLGYFSGVIIKDFVDKWDHWISLIILAGLGSKMIKEAIGGDGDEPSFDIENLLVLLSLSVATSIDALAVGFTFSLIDLSIYHASFIISLITFFIAFIGVIIGCNFGKRLKQNAEILGGVILILVGIKIFLQDIL